MPDLQVNWQYDWYDDHAAVACSDRKKDYAFTVEWAKGTKEKQKIKDIHLITAAPDLLTVCRQALGHLKHWPVLNGEFNNSEALIIELEAIIKKAEAAQ